MILLEPKRPHQKLKAVRMDFHISRFHVSLLLVVFGEPLYLGFHVALLLVVFGEPLHLGFHVPLLLVVFGELLHLVLDFEKQRCFSEPQIFFDRPIST